MSDYLVDKLVALSRDGGDANTGDVIRAYGRKLPDAALTTILEAVSTGRARNRAAYIVGALRNEVAKTEGATPS